MSGKKILLVIDMQNDFITGALANKEGEKIAGAIKDRIDEYRRKGNPVFFTRDTHFENYMETQEGRKLPVPHCIKGTEGHGIIPGLIACADGENVFDKSTFGSLGLPGWLRDKTGGVPEGIELCGVCTDICVISNAMILKAAFPEIPVIVDSSLCAGTTSESHRNALEAMKMCQVDVR